MSLHPSEIVEVKREVRVLSPVTALIRHPGASLGPTLVGGTGRVDISQNEMRFRGSMGKVVDMKKVICCSPMCASKPTNHENLSPRGAQFFWVVEEEVGPWFCSQECSEWGRKAQERLEGDQGTLLDEVEVEGGAILMPS